MKCIMLITSLFCINLIAKQTERDYLIAQLHQCMYEQEIAKQTKECPEKKKLIELLRKINILCIRDQMNTALCDHLLKDAY